MTFKKGYMPWNKGKEGYSHSGNFKKGDVPWNKGTKGLMGHNHTGFKKGHEVNVGRKRPDFAEWSKKNKPFKGKNHSEKTKKLMRRIMKGKNTSPETQFKKGHKPSSEMIKKMLHKNIKSSLEIKFEEIIQKNNLPYKFVGNGEFLIERKCPDFINTNGEKIAIEVFYRRHKEKFKGSLKDWMKDREKIFKGYGWELLFFNEIQVNENNILKKLEVDINETTEVYN